MHIDIEVIIVIIVMIALAGSIIWQSVSARHKKISSYYDEEAEQPEDAYIASVIEKYGEPTEVIVRSPMISANDRLPLLLYNGFMVADGVVINYKEIKSVTFNNRAMPYIPNDYQVLISTTVKGQELIHISAGNDIDWAKEIAEKLRIIIEK